MELMFFSSVALQHLRCQNDPSKQEVPEMRSDNAQWRVMKVRRVSLMSREMLLHGADYCHGFRLKTFF